MDKHAEAEMLAKRPYLLMTSLDETTEGQPIYFARVVEIDGCYGQGESLEEAIKDLRLAMVDFIESLLEDGLTPPNPTQLTEPTRGTASKALYTFTNQDKTLKQKQTVVDNNAYFLNV